MKMTRWMGASCAVLMSVATLTAADIEKNQAEVTQRLQYASEVFREIMGTPDKSVPSDLLEKAHCAIIIPGMKKGAFIVGAKYGKGFITCRGETRAWSAPANVRVEGGSVGFQIGGGEVDLFLLVMNASGAKRLLKSEFKIGGEASAMAGPVGRTVQANTDAYMRAEILGWSRSRGAFAGIALEGSTLREDMDDNKALYGRALTNEQIIHGGTPVPAAGQPLITQLSRYSAREK
jgi:lipid-binding SYLF domain-containing protein